MINNFPQLQLRSHKNILKINKPNIQQSHLFPTLGEVLKTNVAEFHNKMMM